MSNVCENVSKAKLNLPIINVQQFNLLSKLLNSDFVGKMSGVQDYCLNSSALQTSAGL